MLPQIYQCKITNEGCDQMSGQTEWVSKVYSILLCNSKLFLHAYTTRS